LPANLRKTYEQSSIHDGWESVYRGNPRQDRLNDALMDRIVAEVGAPPDGLFLDAGCGVGDQAIRIAKRGYRCMGVDISSTILADARRRVDELHLDDRVSFSCQGLEDLGFDAVFDAVHCRGVLMHIPDWERALASLCRAVKPGGALVIVETNTQGLELALVKLVRTVQHRKSEMRETPGGVEFWSTHNDEPFVVRVTRQSRIVELMRDNGVRAERRLPTEFIDPHRFGGGFLRNTMIQVNRLYLGLGLPARFTSSNLVIGRKA